MFNRLTKAQNFEIIKNLIYKMDNKRKYDNEDDLIILKENQEDSEAKRAHYLSYTERYFKRYYKLNVKYACNDHLVLMHSNRVAVCGLAPSHPVLDTTKYQIDHVEFIQEVSSEMRGKHKHNAKNVNVLQPLCKIYCKKLQENMEECYFVIYTCLNAKLLETNERLLTMPELVQTKPATEGFLAILMPKLDNLNDQIASELITHAEYLDEVNKRNQESKMNE